MIHQSSAYCNAEIFVDFLFSFRNRKDCVKTSVRYVGNICWILANSLLFINESIVYDSGSGVKKNVDNSERLMRKRDFTFIQTKVMGLREIVLSDEQLLSTLRLNRHLKSEDVQDLYVLTNRQYWPLWRQIVLCSFFFLYKYFMIRMINGRS